MVTRFSIHHAHGLFVFALALLLGGCVTVASNRQPAIVEGGNPSLDDGLQSVVVGPGDSRTCRNESCRIHYRMPDLEGEAEVAVNNFLVGTFPPGELVDLGTWSEPSIRIRIVDADVPRAFVNMLGSGGN